MDPEIIGLGPLFITKKSINFKGPLIHVESYLAPSVPVISYSVKPRTHLPLSMNLFP